MSNQGCSNCAALEAENAALRLENMQLKRRLAAIRFYCQTICEYTQNNILNRTSGVERGKWAYARGTYAVAEVVERMT